MKILLILPKDSTYQSNGAFSKPISYAPLTLTTLAALVPKKLNADITIIDEGVQKPDYGKTDWDIVGITCVTSSAPRAYELSSYFRTKGIFVVLGGAHPTLMPDEASEHADSVVTGVAVKTWPQLLKDYAAGKTKSIYTQGRCKTLVTPTPRRDLQKRAYLGIPTVQATMGCGNHCEYCSINKLWGDNFKRDIPEVIDEIRSLNSKKVLFLDPNLTYDKEYAKELFSALINLNIAWGGSVETSMPEDNELLELAVKSGCMELLMGFESFSQDSLKKTSKEANRVDNYKHIVKTLHKHQIPVMGTFVLGLDGDTKRSLLNTVEYIDDLGLDLARYAVLTPFPGTRLFDRFVKEERIITKNWFYYDHEHVVYKPEQMRPEELQLILTNVWKKTYSTQKIFKRVSRTPRNKGLHLAANIGFKHYARNLAKGIEGHLAS